MRFELDQKYWVFESNGKLHFKQKQLFQLHRLMLVMLSTTGRKLRYETPKQLKQLLQAAMVVDNFSVQTQLKAALSTLPDKWGGQKIAC